MKTWISCGLLTLALSGCMGLGGDRRSLSEICAGLTAHSKKGEPAIRLSPSDKLSRRTLEDIAALNENLREICVD
jgi:hypothetical protein